MSGVFPSVTGVTLGLFQVPFPVTHNSGAIPGSTPKAKVTLAARSGVNGDLLSSKPFVYTHLSSPSPPHSVLWCLELDSNLLFRISFWDN